jgi:hypothetical protein
MRKFKLTSSKIKVLDHKGVKFSVQKEIAEEVLNYPETISMAKDFGLDLENNKEDNRKVVTNILTAIKVKKSPKNNEVTFSYADKIGSKKINIKKTISLEDYNKELSQYKSKRK